MSTTSGTIAEAIFSARQRILQLEGDVMQLSAPLPQIGTVVHADPALAFTAKDYPDGGFVRVISGSNAGRMGKVSEQFTNADGLYVRVVIDGEDNDFLLTRTNPTPSLVNFKGDIVDNPHPSQYVFASSITWNREQCDIIDGHPNTRGEIVVMNSKQEVLNVYVGYSDLIVPAGKSAGKAYILFEGKLMSCEHPQTFTIEKGDNVELNEAGQIIRIVEGVPAMYGGQALYLDTVKGGMLEVESDAGKKIVFNFTGKTNLEKGDIVVLDREGISALLAKPSPLRTKQQNFKPVQWEEIIGHENAKEAIRDAVESPITHAELFTAFNRKGSKGIMLYGPRGSGKTMLAKATWTSIQQYYGGAGSDEGFLYLKGPELLSQWVGVAEAMIRTIFDSAREFKAKYGYPKLIFIDESEAILFKRGAMRSSDVNNTIVPQFLAELDGLEDSAAILLLATNRPDMIDPAVIRKGRCDSHIYVGRPDANLIGKLFEAYIGKVPVVDQTEAELLASCATNALNDPKNVLYRVEYKDGRVPSHFTFADLASGALVATIVDQACAVAMRRNIAATKGGKKVKPCLIADDLQAAIQQSFLGQVHLSHESDLSDFVRGKESDVKDIFRVQV